jgi:hypothetical protein
MHAFKGAIRIADNQAAACFHTLPEAARPEVAPAGKANGMAHTLMVVPLQAGVQGSAPKERESFSSAPVCFFLIYELNFWSAFPTI